MHRQRSCNFGCTFTSSFNAALDSMRSDDDDDDDGEDVTTTKTTKKRSIDYLLAGTTVRTNPHVKAFVEHHVDLVRRLREDATWASWANVHGRTLRKEIAESMAACGLAERELIRGGWRAEEEGDGRRQQQQRVVVFDLCSGKGFSAVVASRRFGSRCEVHMVDANEKMDLSHLKSEPRIRFHGMDVYDARLDALVKEAREDAETSRVVIVGVHLCGDLSRRAIELFARHRVDVLVLSPCCLVREVRPHKRPHGTFGYGLPKVVRRFGGDAYDLWAKLLYATVPSHVGDDFAVVRKTMSIDEHVMGEKNRFITARRVSPADAECEPCAD